VAASDLPVALVIPVFNGTAFLAEALHSVLVQQACRIAAIIVVDDGSTDASAALAAAFPAPVQVIRQPHAGAAAARNRGLAATSEDCIGFLDADDRLPPGSVAARVAALRSDPGLDAAIGLTSQFISPELDNAVAARFQGADRPAGAPLLGAMLFRRHVFDRVGGFDTGLGHGDFIDWYLRAKAAGLTSRQCDAVVLERRIHGGNLTLRDPGGRKDYLTVVRRHLARQR